MKKFVFKLTTCYTNKGDEASPMVDSVVAADITTAIDRWLEIKKEIERINQARFATNQRTDLIKSGHYVVIKAERMEEVEVF